MQKCVYQIKTRWKNENHKKVDKLFTLFLLHPRILPEHPRTTIHIIDFDFLPHLYISSGLKKEAGGSIEEEGDSSTVAVHVVVDEPPKVVCFFCGVQTVGIDKQVI